MLDLHDYEKLVISLCLNDAEGKELIPQKLILNLSDDKFESAEHKLIWRAIGALTMEDLPCNVANVATKLGLTNLETVGGDAYLRSLMTFSTQMGVKTDWQLYAEIIDKAGTLRHIGLVIEKYHQLYEDFSKLISNVENVTEFIQKFTDEIQQGFKSLDTGYRPIGEAVTDELKIARGGAKGQLDLLDCGFLSLREFGIPYERSFGVILGLRSMGKTQAGLIVALGKAIELKQNEKEGVVSINSLETPGNLLARRLACYRAGIDSMQIKLGQLSEDDFNRYVTALEEIKNLPIMFNDDPSVTSSDLVLHATAQSLKHKRVLGLSDYAELFQDKTKDNEELRVATIVKNHRQIAWKTGSCEMLISQVNNSVYGNQYKIAGLERARYSGVFQHATDWAIEVWNPPQMTKSQISFKCPEQYDPEFAYWFVVKNKNGPLGDIRMRWIPEKTRFVDTKNPVGDQFKFGESEVKKTESDY